MNNSQPPIARKTGLVVQEMPDELLVFDTLNNKAHCLNKTAAFVWKSCDGKKTAAEIAGLFQTGSEGKVSEEMVWLAIDQLNENDLLEQKINSIFAGQTRREVIKKIGFASIVALPVVASLVAPKNALAAASCSCNSDASCNSTPKIPCAPAPRVCNAGTCTTAVP